MITFAHRDRRLAIVVAAIDAAATRAGDLEAALNALPEDADPNERSELEDRLAAVQALQATLDAEGTELAADGFEVSDEAAGALAADWLWRTAPGLLDALAADPALLAAEATPQTSPAAAAAIEALPRAPGDPRPGFLDEVAMAAGPTALDELIAFALGRWLREPGDQRSHPFRDIGVLLPLRLETLFDEQPDGSWALSLRVIPEEPSVRRDQAKATEIETECLQAFWDRSRVMAPVATTTAAEWLRHPDGIVAWEQLAARVTAPRAAWLVTTFATTLAGGAFAADLPAERIGAPEPDRVGGLPPRLEVWLVEKNGREGAIGSLEPKLAELKMPVPSSKEAFESWLIAWDRGQDVGMGGVFALPPGCTPDTIEALYVYGIGEEHPAAQFVAHADAGTVGLLRLGAPTNTVHAAPAADLALDADTWRRVAAGRLAGERNEGSSAIARALCGDEAALPYLPGGSRDVEESRRLVQTLWPALWGHYFRDFWDCADDADWLGLWAMEWLHPEGPLPPIRIGAQPYGLLPITALEHWRLSGASEQDRIEARIVDAINRLRSVWAEAGEAGGTIVDADARQLLRLLARPGVSSRYLYRSHLPAELLAGAYPSVAQAAFLAASEQAWAPASDVLQHPPSRLYLAYGHVEPLRLPLIGADRLPFDVSLANLIEELYRTEGDRFADVFYERMGGIVPDSLLLRLLMHSVLLAKAWYMESVTGPPGPLLNPPTWRDPVDLTPLEELQNRFTDAEQNGQGPDPIARLVRVHRDRVFDLVGELDQYLERGPDLLIPGSEVNQLKVPHERQAELERALRATLDSAGRRIDPWATGVAWRRLSEHAASPRRRHRLGAYGWLDGPFRGTPGPNRAGRLHAPSHAQAITSIILRDKFLSAQDELTTDGRNIWSMNLASASVRLAIEMADEVRMGFHVFDVVGRRVEGIVGRPDRVRELRRAKPLRPERPDDRDVCHGLDALDALLSESVAGVLSDDPDEREGQLRQLAGLKAALEAYRDLLVAEGVHLVVAGHGDIAGEVMDAAGGFSRPPAIEFVRTPPSGYRLPTSVVAVLPHRPPVTVGNPIALVDASLAAFLEARFSDPGQWTWRLEWKEAGPGGDVDRSAPVTLAELGLSPLDAVLVPEDFMIEAARVKAGVPLAEVTPPPAHRLARQLAATLGTRPAVHADLARASDVPPAILRQSEADVRAELAGRYRIARDAAVKFATEIDEPGQPEASDAERTQWLRGALAWGIVGPADPEARKDLLGVLFGEQQPSPEALRALVAHGKAALSGRLASALDEESLGKQPAADLARALAAIASPDGRLTVCAEWSAAALLAAAELRTEVAAATLDEEWLTVTATVRPALARLEALQLEARLLQGFEPLQTWTNAGEGPWQTKVVNDNAVRRRAVDATAITTERLVASYGPDDVWQGTDVAVALIDAFSEAIPMAERTTFAAFGFNAPAARAPQAILLAVPSRSDLRLGIEEVLAILKETRALVRGRAAEAVGHPIAPGMWFQAAGPLRMRLDTGTQYWR